MTKDFGNSRSTSVSQWVHAPREVLYRALLDPQSVARWLAPDTMRGEVHKYDAREGGRFRMSLTYTEPEDADAGKTTGATDTFEGTFIEVIPNRKMVWAVEFESEKVEFSGVMRMTWSLKDADGGTEVTVFCEDIPAGIRLEDNELGSKQTLQNLKKFVEG